ncbi:ubiquitin carboxyl-terminal hydrolase 9-like [Rosa rugosa]|uniref:ubiquitin carboxyl-terminal hydrolase 9-like n=1 Tax=Rosa rugosa TaxID=74645 RepID=UPI002B4043B2|nr:ubiquitin carboxyl-terminal hydrolase 9-like [Rosa rugosa]
MTIPDSGFMMENEASCLPHTPEEEKRIIDELTRQSEANVKEGNLFYVISNRWFSSWKMYVEQGTGENDKWDSESQHMDLLSSKINRPGPIDNSDIVEKESEGGGGDLQLRRMLMEELDYVLVSQEVWEKLFDWYKGGPSLPRKMISQGGINKNLMVEVYPLCLKIVDSRDNSQAVIWLSKKASVQELYEKVRTIREIEQQKACIWDYFNKQKQSLLNASNQTLEQLNLQMDQEVLLEVQVDGNYSSQISMDSTGNELALVTVEPSRSSMTIAGGPTLSNGHLMGYNNNMLQGSTVSGSASTDTDDRPYVYNPMKKGDKGGLAGLQNLGNTCFMNSSLQCLVHTPPLVDYFLQDYSDEINTDNPLGMHGELALAFGELLRKLWSSGRTTIAPRAFKGKLARFAPQFSGYNQHDSQELLAFLLDGLHEDLNRVKNKPYIETKDSDGRPDEEVADECWKNHKARNDSLIVDVCQGQYKSTLVCPSCAKVSITFDPFMYLSVPLPSTVTRSMTVTVLYGDGRGLPMPYTVTLIKDRSVKDLVEALGTACCLKSDESLLLAEIYEHRIYRYLESPSEHLSSIKPDERIVAYRYSKGAGTTRLEIMHRRQEKCALDPLKGQRKLFGTPLVTYLGEDQINGVDIERAVSTSLSPLRRAVKLHSTKENGSTSEAVDEPSNSYNLRSMDNTELEEASSRELSFHLFLALDERGHTCKPLEKFSSLKSGKNIKVFLDWTEKEDESYDASYLENLPEVHKSGNTAKKTRQEAISLFTCLEAFLKEEPLGPSDMWYCPRCKEHRQATKKLDLWMLPEVLVFHLKRFSYSRYSKNKLDSFVTFPIHNLDLSRYVMSKDGKPYIYELYAISNHYGGLGGGHYTAYAKLIDENRWYHFDDSHVSPVSESDIKTSAAYVLFYRRVKSGSNTGEGDASETHMAS